MKTFLYILLVIFAFVAAQDAGGRIIVTTSDMNDVIKQAKPRLEQFLLATKVPDLHITQHIAIVGDVDVTISNLKITNVNFGDLGVQTTLPDKITGKTTTGTIAFSLEWSYRQKNWPHVSGHGDASASATDSVIILIVSFTVANGKPVVKATNVDIQLKNTSLSIHGGATGWFADLIDKLFKDQIRELVQKEIIKEVQNVIDNVANQLISQFDFVQEIKSAGKPPAIDFDFDFTLPVNGIVITDSFLSVSSSLTSRPLGKNIPQPPKVVLPSSPTVPDNTNFYVSDYITNSVFGALQASDQLQYIVLPEQVPDWSPVKMNTSSFKLWLPELYNKFPNQGIRIDIHSTATPKLQTSKNTGMQITANTSLLLSILNGTDIPIKAIQLKVDISGVFTNASLVGTQDGTSFNVSGVLTSMNSNIELERSYIGDVNITKFAKIIQLILIEGQAKSFNKKLAVGIPVPISTLVPGLAIHKPQVIMQDGYLNINGNIIFIPKPLQASNSIDQSMVMQDKIKQLEEQIVSLEQVLKQCWRKVEKMHYFVNK